MNASSPQSPPPPTSGASGASGPDDPEDQKLVTLARASRARTGAPEGAAVRDTTGRTYAASTVDLPSLRLSALQVAVAMAVSSGADGLEAAVVLGEAGALDATDRAVVGELGGAGTPIWRVGPDGTPQARVE